MGRTFISYWLLVEIVFHLDHDHQSIGQIIEQEQPRALEEGAGSGALAVQSPGASSDIDAVSRDHGSVACALAGQPSLR